MAAVPGWRRAARAEDDPGSNSNESGCHWMFVAVVENAKLKTYLNIANENMLLRSFCNFQLGWLQKNQTYL